MDNKKYFEVSAAKYIENKSFSVVRVSSLENPKNSSVMFISEGYMHFAEKFNKVNGCLIFWPASENIPDEINEKHAVVKCENPHLQYCRFFTENKINDYPEKETVDFVDGYFISPKATVGKNTTIMPGAYIGGNVIIGDDCYIGAGVKIVGEVQIGNRVVIRENSCLGANSITTDREPDSTPVPFPQFGGVVIGDDVKIGTLVVVARGAIDDTRIGKGTVIDNCSLISHNSVIGENTFVIGETMTFGSVTVGDRVMLSGNSVIRNGVTIGDDALVGMGAVVIKDVPANCVVKGNPAK